MSRCIHPDRLHTPDAARVGARRESPVLADQANTLGGMHRRIGDPARLHLLLLLARRAANHADESHLADNKHLLAQGRALLDIYGDKHPEQSDALPAAVHLSAQLADY